MHARTTAVIMVSALGALLALAPSALFSRGQLGPGDKAPALSGGPWLNGQPSPSELTGVRLVEFWTFG